MKSILVNHFVFIMLFLLASCGDNNFRDRYELGQARILGVFLSSPEISPGDTTTMGSVVSFENQSTQTLESRLRYCPDPGLFYGVDPTCENAANTVLVYDWTPLNFSNPNVKTEAFSTLGTLSAPPDFLDQSSESEKTQGKIILVEVSIRVDGTQNYHAFSRLRVSDPTLKPTKNSNPVLTDILLDQGSLVARPASLSGELGVSFDATSLQTGEELLTSVYVSRGKIKYSRIVGNQTTKWELTSQESAEAQQLTVVAIGRDENGGFAVQIKSGL